MQQEQPVFEAQPNCPRRLPLNKLIKRRTTPIQLSSERFRRNNTLQKAKNPFLDMFPPFTNKEINNLSPSISRTRRNQVKTNEVTNLNLLSNYKKMKTFYNEVSKTKNFMESIKKEQKELVDESRRQALLGQNFNYNSKLLRSAMNNDQRASEDGIQYSNYLGNRINRIDLSPTKKNSIMFPTNNNERRRATRTASLINQSGLFHNKRNFKKGGSPKKAGGSTFTKARLVNANFENPYSDKHKRYLHRNSRLIEKYEQPVAVEPNSSSRGLPKTKRESQDKKFVDVFKQMVGDFSKKGPRSRKGRKKKGGPKGSFQNMKEDLIKSSRIFREKEKLNSSNSSQMGDEETHSESVSSDNSNNFRSMNHSILPENSFIKVDKSTGSVVKVKKSGGRLSEISEDSDDAKSSDFEAEKTMMLGKKGSFRKWRRRKINAENFDIKMHNEVETGRMLIMRQIAAEKISPLYQMRTMFKNIRDEFEDSKDIENSLEEPEDDPRVTYIEKPSLDYRELMRTENLMKELRIDNLERRRKRMGGKGYSLVGSSQKDIRYPHLRSYPRHDQEGVDVNSFDFQSKKRLRSQRKGQGSVSSFLVDEKSYQSGSKKSKKSEILSQKNSKRGSKKELRKQKVAKKRQKKRPSKLQTKRGLKKESKIPSSTRRQSKRGRQGSKRSSRQSRSRLKKVTLSVPQSDKMSLKAHLTPISKTSQNKGSTKETKEYTKRDRERQQRGSLAVNQRSQGSSQNYFSKSSKDSFFLNQQDYLGFERFGHDSGGFTNQRKHSLQPIYHNNHHNNKNSKKSNLMSKSSLKSIRSKESLGKRSSNQSERLIEGQEVPRLDTKILAKNRNLLSKSQNGGEINCSSRVKTGPERPVVTLPYQRSVEIISDFIKENRHNYIFSRVVDFKAEKYEISYADMKLTKVQNNHKRQKSKIKKSKKKSTRGVNRGPQSRNQSSFYSKSQQKSINTLKTHQKSKRLKSEENSWNLIGDSVKPSNTLSRSHQFIPRGSENESVISFSKKKPKRKKPIFTKIQAEPSQEDNSIAESKGYEEAELSQRVFNHTEDSHDLSSLYLTKANSRAPSGMEPELERMLEREISLRERQNTTFTITPKKVDSPEPEAPKTTNRSQISSNWLRISHPSYRNEEDKENDITAQNSTHPHLRSYSSLMDHFQATFDDLKSSLNPRMIENGETDSRNIESQIESMIALLKPISTPGALSRTWEDTKTPKIKPKEVEIFTNISQQLLRTKLTLCPFGGPLYDHKIEKGYKKFLFEKVKKWEKQISKSRSFLENSFRILETQAENSIDGTNLLSLGSGGRHRGRSGGPSEPINQIEKLRRAYQEEQDRLTERLESRRRRREGGLGGGGGAGRVVPTISATFDRSSSQSRNSKKRLFGTLQPSLNDDNERDYEQRYAEGGSEGSKNSENFNEDYPKKKAKIHNSRLFPVGPEHLNHFRIPRKLPKNKTTKKLHKKSKVLFQSDFAFESKISFFKILTTKICVFTFEDTPGLGFYLLNSMTCMKWVPLAAEVCCMEVGVIYNESTPRKRGKKALETTILSSECLPSKIENLEKEMKFYDKYLVVGDKSGKVSILDLFELELTNIINHGKSAIIGAVDAYFGKTLLSLDSNMILRLWAMESAPSVNPRLLKTYHLKDAIRRIKDIDKHYLAEMRSKERRRRGLGGRSVADRLKTLALMRKLSETCLSVFYTPTLYLFKIEEKGEKSEDGPRLTIQRSLSAVEQPIIPLRIRQSAHPHSLESFALLEINKNCLMYPELSSLCSLGKRKTQLFCSGGESYFKFLILGEGVEGCLEVFRGDGGAVGSGSESVVIDYARQGGRDVQILEGDDGHLLCLKVCREANTRTSGKRVLVQVVKI